MFYCINFKTFLRIKKVKARFMSGSRASKQLTCMYCTYPAYCEPVSKLSRALLRRGEKRNESLQLRLWNLNSAPNSPMAPLRLSCQISANQHKVETNAKKNMWRVMTSFLMLSPPISISHWLFRCTYSNSRDVVESSPSLPPPQRPRDLARKLAYC